MLSHNFKIPNGDNAWKLFLNHVLKFHNDLTANVSKIIIFLRQVWWATEKRKGFWGGGEEKRIERMNNRKSYRLT